MFGRFVVTFPFSSFGSLRENSKVALARVAALDQSRGPFTKKTAKIQKSTENVAGCDGDDKINQEVVVSRLS